MAVPQPRRPVCTAHHVFMAGCAACVEQRTAERAEAGKRLKWAAG